MTAKRLLLGMGLAVIVLTVLAGYGFDWKWTGFPGNTLWDWMNLLLLPVALSVVPLAFETSTAVLRRVAAGAAVVLVVLLAGGYGLKWSWTGFAGNTLWDWLHLLLVPVALPFFAHELNEQQKKKRALAEARLKAAEEGAALPGTAQA